VHVCAELLKSFANGLLNESYGDSGDNLSVPLCDMTSRSRVRYLAGNYASASLPDVKSSIDALDKIPGSVILITSSGVGANAAQTLGLLQNGRLEELTGVEHSFYSFAEDHLSVKGCEEEAQLPAMEQIAKKASQTESIQLGSEKEVAARRQLAVVIGDLEALVAREAASQTYGGIGHNQPSPKMKIPKEITSQITININIIKTDIQSATPDTPKVIESVSGLQKIGEEIIEFSRRTSQHLRSDGSRALAAAIIGGIAGIIWYAVKWISSVLGFSFP
jgi:hypothetical protein